jgi:hypothetical protein
MIVKPVISRRRPQPWLLGKRWEEGDGKMMEEEEEEGEDDMKRDFHLRIEEQARAFRSTFCTATQVKFRLFNLPVSPFTSSHPGQRG